MILEAITLDIGIGICGDDDGFVETHVEGETMTMKYTYPRFISFFLWKWITIKYVHLAFFPWKSKLRIIYVLSFFGCLWEEGGGDD